MRLPYLFLWIIVALTFGSIFHGNLLHEEAAFPQSPVFYDHHPGDRRARESCRPGVNGRNRGRFCVA